MTRAIVIKRAGTVVVLPSTASRLLQSRLNAVEQQQFVATSVASRVGGVIDLQTAFDTSITVPNPNKLYRWRVPGYYDGTWGQISIKLNGGTAYGLYDVLGDTLDPTLLRPFDDVYMRWDNAFGGLWRVSEPRRRHRIDYTGLQLAEQGNLALRNRWLADNLTAWEAISRTTLFDHGFASAGDQGKYVAKLGGVSGTDVAYTHTAGYIQRDLETNSGLWFDPNHIWPGPGHLNLPLILQPSTHTDMVGVSSFKDAKLTMNLRLLDFVLPPGVILGWHYQANIDPGGSDLFANYLYTGQLVSDAAGFGIGPNAGLGWPPVLRSISDTGDFDFTVRFIEDDAFWMQLGTSEARAGIGGTSSPLYTVAPIADAFAGNFGTMILVALFPQEATPSQLPAARVKGKLRINSIKMEVA